MCFDSSAQLEHSALNLCLPDTATKMREGASSCKRDRITACLSGHRTRSALPSLIFPTFSMKHFWLFECALVQSGSMRRTKKYFGLLVFGFGYRVLIILWNIYVWWPKLYVCTLKFLAPLTIIDSLSPYQGVSNSGAMPSLTGLLSSSLDPLLAHYISRPLFLIITPLHYLSQKTILSPIDLGIPGIVPV